MKRILMSLAVAALIVVFSSTSRAQEPVKRPVGGYAEYSGQYQFDLRPSGPGPFTARVYEENGGLYIWAETSDSPDRLSPVENSPTKFSLDLPNQGRWYFEFLRDEKGQFTKCHIVNIDLGIDMVGTRIGG